MKRFVLSSILVMLFSIMVVGCGGGSNPPATGGVDPNAPMKKLDPTTLQIPFD